MSTTTALPGELGPMLARAQSKLNEEPSADTKIDTQDVKPKRYRRDHSVAD